MKKLGHILAFSLLLFSLLAGCSPVANQSGASADSGAEEQAVTLRIAIWNNPATAESFKKINEQFQEKYPNITVDMSVDKTEDYWANTLPTRLAAGDVDIFLLQGFPNQVQDYMKGGEKASWQTMVEAGQLLDLTDLGFLENYDKKTLMTAGSFGGKIYTVATGSYAFTGLFYNKDLFEQNGVKVPTTWDELVQACETFKQANIGCMTSGGKDVWPLMVAGWGVQQAIYPDSEATLKDLWEGKLTFNDDKAKLTWQRLQQMLTFMEDGVTGIDNTSAPGRFASGKVAMYPAGTWDAANITLANPELKFGYIPTPGSDKADDNQTLGGKFDASISIAANAPNKEAAIKWLEFFSQPEIYDDYVNAVGILPTQPTAQLTSAIGTEIQPYLQNFYNHISVLWVSPKGIGKYAGTPFSSANFKPYGDFDDADQLANQVQADWEAALKSAQ